MKRETVSIMCDLREKKCYLCGYGGELELHHAIHGTANRRLADEDGLVVYLCPVCHRALHDQGWRDRDLEQAAQFAWMMRHGFAVNDFIKRYGKSYL